jgi:hypothetical protein
MLRVAFVQQFLVNPDPRIRSSEDTMAPAPLTLTKPEPPGPETTFW